PRAGSAYTIADTPDLDSFDFTFLTTGAGGADTVHVNGTTGGLDLYNLDGHDDVYIGNGTLSAIGGDVLVGFSASGSTSLYVRDGQDNARGTATLDSGSLSGLSTGEIRWYPSAHATGGVTSLDIVGPAAGSSYVINDTPDLFFETTLHNGALYFDNLVVVNGTTGRLRLDKGGGFDLVVGRDGQLTPL